jgi:hypothetical protein
MPCLMELARIRKSLPSPLAVEHALSISIETVLRLVFSWEQNFGLIRRKGTIVSLGNASCAMPPFAPLKLAPKNLKVLHPVYVFSSSCASHPHVNPPSDDILVLIFSA